MDRNLLLTKERQHSLMNAKSKTMVFL